MKLGYDIFRQLDDGSPIWIANVQTRPQAQQKVATLRSKIPARYLIRDTETGAVISDSELGAGGEILREGNYRTYARALAQPIRQNQ